MGSLSLLTEHHSKSEKYKRKNVRWKENGSSILSYIKDKSK